VGAVAVIIFVSRNVVPYPSTILCACGVPKFSLSRLSFSVWAPPG
jgi:hypothetical protein